MTNTTFHKLRLEFNITYEYNDRFRDYVDANFEPFTNMYGSVEFSTQDMKTARDYWRKNYKKIAPNYPIFRDYSEVDAWIDAMPFGGYC